MKKIGIHAAVVLIAASPAAYLALIWSSLPQTVPVHWGLDMKPDRFGDKGELWLLALLLGGISVGAYFLLRNLHRIDPKQKGAASSAAFGRLAAGLVVFIAALNIMILTAAKGSTVLQTFLFPVLGLLFAFIGNYMNNLKPNYFAGIRLPWTLSSDDNWRKTHQLGSRLWFAGGLLIAVICLFLPPTAAFVFFLCALLILAVVPIVYSYRLFKKAA